MSNPNASLAFLTPEELLHHWQGHRALTRRVIEAFPEDQLFEFSVAGMRPFGAMGAELLAMALPMVRGVVTGEWEAYAADAAPSSREELLQRWDESTERMNELWPQIPSARFHEVITAFGQYTGPGHELILYAIDNEIHHRGQGYVYLRALGIEPPPFWERGPAGEAG